MMKFRLSTTLLFLALVAVALGWYTDRDSRDKITGSWYGPTSVMIVVSRGYETYLHILPDGTFLKVQTYSGREVSFAGTYDTRDDGLVTFHVSKIGHAPTSSFNPVWSQVDRRFYCRCAIDNFGRLVISELTRSSPAPVNSETPKDPIGDLRWETYQSSTYAG